MNVRDVFRVLDTYELCITVQGYEEIREIEALLELTGRWSYLQGHTKAHLIFIKDERGVIDTAHSGIQNLSRYMSEEKYCCISAKELINKFSLAAECDKIKQEIGL